MSKFYGQGEGMASTLATRRGNRDIKVSAQSWDGSLITRMYYEGDDLMVELQVNDGSSFYGKTCFFGTLEELKKRLG